MNEQEVMQRNNGWLNEIKQIAEKHSATFSFESEVFKLSLNNGRMTVIEELALYDVLMFMRGFNAYSLLTD